MVATLRILLAALLSLSSAPTWADQEQLKFRVLSSVKVTVENLPEGIDALTEDIATRIEMRLREGGVSTTREVALPDGTVGLLRLGAVALPVGRDKLAISVTMRLDQPVQLVTHHPKTSLMAVMAITWLDERLLVSSRAEIRRGRLDQVVDQLTLRFVNEWQSAHAASKP